MAKKTFLQVLKEVWPKLLIFTLMLAITIFQKHPMTLKGMGQSDSEIAEQFKTGEFKTTEFETNYLAYGQIEKILFTAVVFVVFMWFRRRNLKYEEEQMKKYQEQQEKIQNKKQELMEKQCEFSDADIKFYKDFNERQKKKEQRNKVKEQQIIDNEVRNNEKQKKNKKQKNE